MRTLKDSKAYNYVFSNTMSQSQQV